MGGVTLGGFLKEPAGLGVVLCALLEQGPEEVGVSNRVLGPVPLPLKKEELVKASRNLHLAGLDGLAGGDVQEGTAHVEWVVVGRRQGAVILDQEARVSMDDVARGPGGGGGRGRGGGRRRGRAGHAGGAGRTQRHIPLDGHGGQEQAAHGGGRSGRPEQAAR